MNRNIKKAENFGSFAQFQQEAEESQLEKKKKVCLDSITWQEATVYSPSVDCSPCDYGY